MVLKIQSTLNQYQTFPSLCGPGDQNIKFNPMSQCVSFHGMKILMTNTVEYTHPKTLRGAGSKNKLIASSKINRATTKREINGNKGHRIKKGGDTLTDINS